MSVPGVWKLELPPGVIMARLGVVVIHATEAYLFRDGLSSRHVRYKAGFGRGSAL
jgi:hypothetical protein